MHRRLWLNDPDCILVRADRSRLTLDEVQTLAAVIGLTDGMLVSGDRLDALSEERRALLLQANELSGGAARVVDLFDRDPPSLVHCVHADGVVIGVFNFDARAAQRTVEIPGPLAGDSVRELWSGAVLPVRDGRVTLDAIPPHGCRLLRFQPPAEGAVP